MNTFDQRACTYHTRTPPFCATLFSAILLMQSHFAICRDLSQESFFNVSLYIICTSAFFWARVFCTRAPLEKTRLTSPPTDLSLALALAFKNTVAACREGPVQTPHNTTNACLPDGSRVPGGMHLCACSCLQVTHAPSRPRRN